MWKRNFFKGTQDDIEPPKSPKTIAIEKFLTLCEKGEREQVDFLLNLNESMFINTTTFEDVSLLFACVSGDLDFVKYLIESRGCRLNSCNIHGETPLHVACLKGDRGIISYLFDQGAILYITEAKMTCFHYACKSANAEGIKIILHQARTNRTFNPNGVDLLNLPSDEEDTPLHIACRSGNKEVVDVLMKETTLTRFVRNGRGDTALMSSVESQSSNLAVTDSLLSDLSETCKSDWINNCYRYDTFETALHLACRHLLPRHVYLLLRNSASVRVTMNDGSTPLHCVCWGDFHVAHSDQKKKRVGQLYERTHQQRKLIIRELAKAVTVSDGKLKADDPDNLGMTPAHYICRHGSRFDTEIMKIFCNHDFPIDTPTGNLSHLIDVHPKFPFHSGTTCLHLACVNGSLPLVRLLLQKKANPNVATAEGWTPLHSAIRCHKVCQRTNRLVRLLVAHGADVNARDNKFKTPLILATEDHCGEPNEHHEDMVMFLLSESADVNAQDHTGRTALNNVIKYQFDHGLTVRLLEYGANPNLKEHLFTGEYCFPMRKVLQNCWRDYDENVMLMLLRAGSYIPHITPKHFDLGNINELMTLLIAGGQKKFVPETVVQAIENRHRHCAEDLYMACRKADPHFMYNQRGVLEAATENELDINFPTFYEICRLSVREMIFDISEQCIAPAVWKLELPPLIRNDLLLDLDMLLESYDCDAF